ncbi:MAG: hypothetical protein DRJ38_04660 [Thermoprotei archaeon]|nr:MAG: hypothetical protein DRJ38_04660 [Thermoprotei archaeon]
MACNLEIKNVTSENVDDLINLCIPPGMEDNPLFIKGAEMKKKWALHNIEKYRCIAKLAYVGSKPAGLIQYVSIPEEKVVEITCIFVPEEKNLRKGIGRALFKALLEDMRKPKPFFDNDAPSAFITWAFQVPRRYPQHEFFRKMGFKRVEKDNPFFLYYPLKPGYVYRPKEEKFISLEEDEGKALIFMDYSCPFSVYFMEKIKELIREVAPDIPIRVINMLEEPEEVKKRGKVTFCVVNKKPIKTFFGNKKAFQNEVKEALGGSNS